MGQSGGCTAVINASLVGVLRGASGRGEIRQVLGMRSGIQGVLAGWGLAFVVSSLTPLPARITLWSVGVALALGGGAGVVFGVFPASRAARLDPITALRAE